MATLAERRAELVAAVPSGTTVLGKRQPPYVAVIGEGVDSEHVIRGEVEASFRLAMIAGGWDEEAAVKQLDTMKHAVLTAVRGLTGYRIGALGRDGRRSIAGADYLAADLVVSAHITI